MEQKHTPEPWRVTGTGTIRYIDAPVGNGMLQEVASCMRVEYGDMEANASRIVACVNACSGIATERLERHYNAGGGIDSAMEESALREQIAVYKQRDQLQAERDALQHRWDYYQSFVKSHDATSITDMVVQRDRLRAEVAEFNRLRDPHVLHINLCRGFPAKLSAEQLLHIAGDEYQGMAARIRELEAKHLAERAAYLQERDKCDKLLAALEDVVSAWEKGDDVFGGVQRASAAISEVKGGAAC